MKINTVLQYITTFFKGMAMGAADIVPGVSGGTIAFITGIYDRLLGAINSVNFSVLKTLKNQGIVAAWKQIDGTFLIALLIGMLSSIVVLSSPITYLLQNHPVLIWSFFFGLVLASVWLVGKQIKNYNITNILIFILASALAYWITTLDVLNGSDNFIYIFLAGSIAICAMILPGISGAFILLILGVYQIVINAIHDRDIKLIAVFGLGCIVGLLSFSRLLKWLLNNKRAQTLAMLTGFLLGSLNKIWPWKNRVGNAPIHVHSDGREEWILKPVLPTNFEGEHQLTYALSLFIAGVVLILVMSRFEKKQ
jgi:putative membrane protein